MEDRKQVWVRGIGYVNLGRLMIEQQIAVDSAKRKLAFEESRMQDLRNEWKLQEQGQVEIDRDRLLSEAQD